MSTSSLITIDISLYILLILFIVLFINIIFLKKKLKKVIEEELDQEKLNKYKQSAKYLKLNNIELMSLFLLSGMMLDRMFLYNDNCILWFILIINLVLIITSFLEFKNLNNIKGNKRIKPYRNKITIIKCVINVIIVILLDLSYYVFWSIN